MRAFETVRDSLLQIRDGSKGNSDAMNISDEALDTAARHSVLAAELHD